MPWICQTSQKLLCNQDSALLAHCIRIIFERPLQSFLIGESRSPTVTSKPSFVLRSLSGFPSPPAAFVTLWSLLAAPDGMRRPRNVDDVSSSSPRRGGTQQRAPLDMREYARFGNVWNAEFWGTSGTLFVPPTGVGKS